MAPQGQGPRPSVWSFSLFLPLLPPLPLLFRASCVCYLPRAVSEVSPAYKLVGEAISIYLK